MANPYSTPAIQTYTAPDLAPFAELIGAKENAYQTGLAKTAELRPQLLVQPGMRTGTLASEINQQYAPQLQKISEDLILDKDYNKAAQSMISLKSQFDSDPYVQITKKDAELTPKVREMMWKNQNGYFGFTDDNTYGGKVTEVDRNYTLSRLEEEYMNMYAGPQMYKDYEGMYSKLPSEYKDHLVHDYEVVDTPIGPRLRTSEGVIITETKQLEQLMDKGLLDHLKTEFDNQSTQTSMFYNAAKDLPAFIADFQKTFKPFDETKVKQNIGFRDIDGLTKNADGSLSLGKPQIDPATQYQIQQQTVDGVQLTDFSGDFHSVPKTMEEVNKKIASGELKYTDAEFIVASENMAEYQRLVDQHNNSPEVLADWNNYKKNNDISDTEAATFDKLNKWENQLLGNYGIAKIKDAKEFLKNNFSKEEQETIKELMGTTFKVLRDEDDISKSAFEKAIFHTLAPEFDNKKYRSPKEYVEKLSEKYKGFSEFSTIMDNKLQESVQDQFMPVKAWGIASDGAGKAINEVQRRDLKTLMEVPSNFDLFQSVLRVQNSDGKVIELKNGDKIPGLDIVLNEQTFNAILSNAPVNEDVLYLDKNSGYVFGTEIEAISPSDSSKKVKMDVQLAVAERPQSEAMNNPSHILTQMGNRYQTARVGTGEKNLRFSDAPFYGMDINQDAQSERIVNKIPRVTSSQTNLKDSRDVTAALDEFAMHLSATSGVDLSMKPKFKDSESWNFQAVSVGDIVDKPDQPLYINYGPKGKMKQVTIGEVYGELFAGESGVIRNLSNPNTQAYIRDIVGNLQSAGMKQTEAANLLDKMYNGTLSTQDISSLVNSKSAVPMWFRDKQTAAIYMYDAKK